MKVVVDADFVTRYKQQHFPFLNRPDFTRQIFV